MMGGGLFHKEGDRMNYIGEFQKNSTLLLELLTMVEENQSIPTDFPVTASISHYERNGLHEVVNVKLETMEIGYRYALHYSIPLDWNLGEYVITYKAIVGKTEYTTQEKFILSGADLSAQELISDVETVEEIEEAATTSNDYIMPQDFAIALAKDPEVDGNKITLTLNENIKYNHTYQVVLDKDVKALSGTKLGAVKTITFTSEYKPLFATPTELRTILRSLYKYFSTHDLYSALRDAGEKAMQLLGNVADPNNSRYRDMRESDTKLFPTQKFAMHEAARILLTNLMVRILNGADADEVEAGNGMISDLGGSITLGDFSVTDSSSEYNGMGGSERAKEETPLRKLQTIINNNEKDLKFWRDSMMGRNARGYASPVTASTRTAAGSPTGRDF